MARHLLGGAAGTAGVHLAATLLALLASIALARILGPEGYGTFVFATALVYLLAIPAVAGFDQLLVREVARLTEAGESGAVAGILRRADQTSLGVALLLTAITAATTAILSDSADSRSMAAAVYVAIAAIPLLSLVRVRQAALQGLQKIVQGQLPETVVLPTLFLLLVGGYVLWGTHPLTAPLTVALHVAALLASLLLADAMLRRQVPAEVREAQPRYRTREWLASSMPLMFVAGLHVINARADTMMLAAMDGAEAVGIYNVASRGAGFVGFFLMAGQRALAPTIAQYHQRGNRQRLQEIVTVANRLIVTASIPVALAFIFGGKWILTLVYGLEFSAGAGALALLSGAYLAGVAMGPVAPLVVMTGHERAAAWGVALSGVLNIVLNAALIPHFGLMGAAVATGISLIVWNALFVLVVRRNLGLRPTVLAPLKPSSTATNDGTGA